MTLAKNSIFENVLRWFKDSTECLFIIKDDGKILYWFFINKTPTASENISLIEIWIEI